MELVYKCENCLSADRWEQLKLFSAGFFSFSWGLCQIMWSVLLIISVELTQTSPVGHCIDEHVFTHDKPQAQGRKGSILVKQGGQYRCWTHNLILWPFLLSLMFLILLEPASGRCVWQKDDAGSIKSACFTKFSCSHANLLCNQQISISSSAQSVNKIVALNLSLAAGI